MTSQQDACPSVGCRRLYAAITYGCTETRDALPLISPLMASSSVVSTALVIRDRSRAAGATRIVHFSAMGPCTLLKRWRASASHSASVLIAALQGRTAYRTK